MRILLIKPKHVGDTLILTPTIVALKESYPQAEIWVMVRRGCEGVLAGCPEITRVLTLAGVEKHERGRGDFWRQVKMLLDLRRVKFDHVFELGDGHRGRLFAMLVRARRRYSVRPASPLGWFERRRFAVSAHEWRTCHRVEKDFRSVSEFLPLTETKPPPLKFERQATRAWEPAAALTDFAVLQVGKRQSVSRWRREGWEEVGRWLLTRVESIVVTSGSDRYELELARWLRERLGPRVLATEGRADWAQVAGLLDRARIYVGLDTAAMHLAAACGCPAVALFGPTYEVNWHPWRSPYRIVTAPSYRPGRTAEESMALVKTRTMDAIDPRDVITACDEMLSTPRGTIPS